MDKSSIHLIPGFSFWRLAKPYARAATILVDEFDARTTQHVPYHCKRCGVSGVPTDFNICNCVPMQAGRGGEISDAPIQGSPSHPNLCTCHRLHIVLLSHVHFAQ
jgi:hypothetical protein